MEALASGYVALVLGVLRAAQVDDPICSVCLAPGQESELDVLPLVFAGSAVDRSNVLATSEDPIDVWNPFEYRDEEDLVHPTEDGDDETYVKLDDDLKAAWARVREAVEPLVIDPVFWVLARVAHRLNREPLPLSTTDDVAVWIFDEEFDASALREQLAFVLTPATFEALRTSRLIP